MKPSTKIAKESIISFFGTAAGDIMRYLTTVFLARLVGLEYLGIYSLANSVTRLTEVVGKVSLDGGVLWHVSMSVGSQNRECIKKYIGSSLKMGMVFSALAMVVQIVLAGFLSSVVFKGTTLLRTVITVNAVTLPFTILTLIAAYATQGYKLLKYKTFVTNLLGPFLALMTLPAAYFLISAEMAIILPVVVSALLSFVVILIFLKRLSGISLVQVVREKFDFDILRYSLPLMLVSAIGTVMHWLDITMLGYFTDEATVGLYHPAARTAGLARAALVALAGIFGPLLADYFAQNNLAEMRHTYTLVVRWIMTISLPFAVLIMAFPGKIMLLFGEQYTPAATALVVLTCGTLMQALAGIGAPALNMLGRPKANLVNSVIAVVVNVILSILWIPRYGINGAAWASLSSLGLLGFLHTARVWLLIRLQPFSWKLAKPTVASLAAYGVLLAAKPYLLPLHTVWTLSLATIITMLSFGVVLWMLKFDQDDREVATALMIIVQTLRRKPA